MSSDYEAQARQFVRDLESQAMYLVEKASAALENVVVDAARKVEEAEARKAQQPKLDLKGADSPEEVARRLQEFWANVKQAQPAPTKSGGSKEQTEEELRSTYKRLVEETPMFVWDEVEEGRFVALKGDRSRFAYLYDTHAEYNPTNPV